MGKKSSWPTTKPGSEANKVSEGEIATAGNWSSGSNTLWKHTSPLHRLPKMQACVWLDTSKTQIWWLIQQIFHFVGFFCCYGDKRGVKLQVGKLYGEGAPESKGPAKPKTWEELRKQNRVRMHQEIIELPHRSILTTFPSTTAAKSEDLSSHVRQNIRCQMRTSVSCHMHERKEVVQSSKFIF